MSRVALYRKYRSADFGDVIGQDHVVTTLTNALERDLLSHAYLFTGPRGVGKTSVARILARRANQLPAEADTVAHLDIVEIDAASNRGIDEIRDLRERIASAPTTLRYKVYIIDEVHMLTREAFNALLKTLEEPPEHVIFILATTEAHKLPDTILSRTQRFDFRPVSEQALISHLRTIAASESIDITDEALAVIARNSAGSFRDGISLLDQLSSHSTKIDDTLVYNILGLSAREQLDTIISAVRKKEPAKAHDALQKALVAGADPQALTAQLIDYLRMKFLNQAAKKEADAAREYLAMMQRLNEALRDFKYTTQYSLPLELAIYELAASTTQKSAVVASPVQNSVSPTNKTSSQVNASDDDMTKYTKALSYIKTKNNPLYAVMNMADMNLNRSVLTLSFTFSFHKDRVEEHKNQALIEAVMSRVYGRPIELRCEVKNGAKKPVDEQAELVATALEILGGEVVDG